MDLFIAGCCYENIPVDISVDVWNDSLWHLHLSYIALHACLQHVPATESPTIHCVFVRVRDGSWVWLRFISDKDLSSCTRSAISSSITHADRVTLSLTKLTQLMDMNRESVKRKREREADILCCQIQSWSVFWPLWPEKNTRCLSLPSEAAAPSVCSLYGTFSVFKLSTLSLSVCLCMCVCCTLSCLPHSTAFFPFSLLLLWWLPLVGVCVYL